jgi:LemA protein
MVVQKRNWTKWIIIGLVVIILLYAILAYNRLVTLSQNIDGKWSEVENQYQRQSDLIPNLVSVVASAAKVETRFVSDVTEARSRWTTATTQQEKDAAGVSMNNGIAALVNAVAVSEAYPTLQANKQYVALTDELTGTQNRIAVARGNYIGAIQMYNTATMRFPSMIFAKMFGYAPRDYYKADLAAMETPVLGTGQLPN